MVQKLKVCVIGGSGFIGINLCLFLSKAGYDVTATARTGPSFDYMKKIFAHLSSDVETINLDGLDEFAVTLFAQSSPDYDLVINATGYAVQRHQSDEEMARKINSDLPVKLLEAFDGKAKRFLHFGTSYEYGGIVGGLTEYSETLPHTLYGKTKLKGTRTLFDYNLKSTKLVGLRLFGTFGPYETPSKLFPLLFSAHFEKKHVKFSSGFQKVDYMHIENVCDAIVSLINNGFKSDKELYNIGSGYAYSIREISEVFASLSGYHKKIDWGKAEVRVNSENLQFADINKIFTHTGWQPSLPLEQGVLRFINGHQDRQYRRI